MVVHVAWTLDGPRGKIQKSATWHETLWLLPPSCADVHPVPIKNPATGKTTMEPLPKDPNLCDNLQPIQIAELPDYEQPQSNPTPQAQRKFNDLAFSRDEKDLLVTCAGKRYRLRLPRWDSKVPPYQRVISRPTGSNM